MGGMFRRLSYKIGEDGHAATGTLAMCRGLRAALRGTAAGRTTGVGADIRVVGGAGRSAIVYIPGCVHAGRELAYAVGSNGSDAAVFQFSLGNGRWVVALDAAFSAGQLLALSAVSPNNIWAVGENGLIVHKDDSGWHTVASPAPGATLTTIQMFGAGTEGWAAGSLPSNGADRSETVLLHYQDGRWQRDTSIPNAGAIHALHFGERGGWAVGDAIWRYSDGRWSEETAPAACDSGCAWTLTGVRAINADAAWAVGMRIGICAVCAPRYYVVQRTAGQWQVALSGTGVVDEPPRTVPAIVHQEWTSLAAVAFTADGEGVAVGSRGAPPADPVSRQLIVRYRHGQWVYDPTPAAYGTLQGISMFDAEHGLAVGSDGLILSVGYGPQSPPIPDGYRPVGDPKLPGMTFFVVVGHTLSGEFKTYWERNGDLRCSVFRLSEQFNERNADLGAGSSRSISSASGSRPIRKTVRPTMCSWDGSAPNCYRARTVTGATRTRRARTFPAPAARRLRSTPSAARCAACSCATGRRMAWSSTGDQAGPARPKASRCWACR